MSRRKHRNASYRSGLRSYLRRPVVQLGVLAILALVVIVIALAGGGADGTALASEISADQAYQMYRQGTFVLDVRTQQEWDEYHVPNTTLIPLDQLQSRLGELPKDKQIVVVCRSGNRSQQGRDVLRAAGFQATSMTGGLKDWYAKGFPMEGKPPQ